MDGDKYEPDYEVDCVNCGATPTVTVIRLEKIIHRTYMCGVCTWGEAEMTDPDEWNE